MEKRIIDGYEILHAAHIGDQEIVMGFNLQEEAAPYVTASCRYNGIRERLVDTMEFSDGLKALQDFSSRLVDRVIILQEEQDKLDTYGIHREILGENHCIPNSEEINLAGKVVIRKPEILRAEYQTAAHQLALAVGGFGCSPKARGNAVIVKTLMSEENVRWDRLDILGVADPEKLPAWAVQQLERIKQQQKTRDTPHEKER